MTTMIEEVGLLDFETELHLKERDSFVDPFIGLRWHLLRAGDPDYSEAVRRAMLDTPELRAFSRAAERKTIFRRLQSLDERTVERRRKGAKDANGGPEKAEGNGQPRRVFTDEELKRLADETATGGSILRTLESETAGHKLAAEHLVENLTKDDGSPLRVRRAHCGDHAWMTGAPACPQCGKPVASTEWVETKYSPAIALKIWRRTDRVDEAALERVFGRPEELEEAAPNPNILGRGQSPMRLGEALFRWVLERCEHIEEAMGALGEELEGN